MPSETLKSYQMSSYITETKRRLKTPMKRPTDFSKLGYPENLLTDLFLWSKNGLEGPDFIAPAIIANRLPKDIKETLDNLMNERLQEHEMRIVKAFYEFHKSYENIALDENLTKERIRQLIHQALHHLSRWADTFERISRGDTAYGGMIQTQKGPNCKFYHKFGACQGCQNCPEGQQDVSRALPIRLSKSLIRGGIYTVADLCAANGVSITNMPGIGKKASQKLYEHLRDTGCRTDNKHDLL